MKKRELIDAIMNNKEKIPSKDDPRLLSFIADSQRLLNTEGPVVLPSFGTFRVHPTPITSSQNVRYPKLFDTQTLFTVCDEVAGKDSTIVQKPS